MTNVTENAAKRTSKYAAKKMNYSVNKTETVKPINTDEVAETVEVSETQEDDKFRGLPPVVKNFPEHVVMLSLLIKNNAEIRRFTAIGILNYLLQKGEIEGDKRYVSFKWNKFAVKANGLMREYSYTEPFFINALIAAFTSFSASAQRTINYFCKKEMSVGIDKAADQEEINNIVALNEEHENNK